MFKCFLKTALIWGCLATASFAQSVGIQFDKMPIGTKFYYQSWNGESWVSTFQGRKRKSYIVNVDVSKAGRSYRGIQRYTLDGHLQRWNNGGGYTERWRPFSCSRVVGKCTHKWTDSHGKGTSWIMEGTLRGNTLVVKSRPKRAIDMGSATIKLGKFNLTQREDWVVNGQKRWIKLTRIVEPK